MKFPKKIFKRPKPIHEADKTNEADENNKEYLQLYLSEDLEMNRKHLETMFEDCGDIIYRKATLYKDEGNTDVLLIYANNLVNIQEINESIIKPINCYGIDSKKKSIERKVTIDVMEKIISAHTIGRVNSFEEIIAAILSGDTILLIEDIDVGLMLSTAEGNDRSVEESPVENLIRGSRDSFIENVHTNIGLIRQKIKSTALKTKYLTIGSESQTVVSVIYMDNIVNKQALEVLMNKLKEIKIDGIFESGYIEQYLESSPYSPFPQMQISERPDKICGNLLEGKIIILVDGSPLALILPISFFHLFQSPEDYYERALFGNFVRLLRFAGFIIATSLPSIYVALISFHQEMLPMDLIIDLSRTRAQVPFPPVIEALLMEFTIEILREASARLPSSIGQTIGIVGAIVIGEAAIQANIASPTMIIVVAVTALGSYILPHYSTSYALRMIRFPIVLMAATFGAFGIIIAWTWIIVHLCNLDSLGYPYLSPLAPLDADIKKDAFLRQPFWRLKSRPKTARDSNIRRW